MMLLRPWTFADVPPTIVVTKTADPTTLPEPGGDVTYTVSIENTVGRVGDGHCADRRPVRQLARSRRKPDRRRIDDIVQRFAVDRDRCGRYVLVHD